MTTSTATRHGPPAAPPPPRWPYHGRPQRRLLIASLLLLIGAVSPWIDTVAGTVLGVAGAGIYTLAAGGIGLAGAVFFRRRSVVIAHAVVTAVTPLVLGGWQAARLVAIGCDLRVCAPSFGLVLTLAGGIVAASATLQLLRGVGDR